MNTTNTSEPTAANAPLISITLSSDADNFDGMDPCSACAQWMPANEYKFYIKIVMAMFGVFGGLLLGIYLLISLFS